MKLLKLSGLVLGLACLGSAALAEEATPMDGGQHHPLVCVGGPVGPSYAYTDYSVANECAARVGSYSRACRTDVRIGDCRVFNRGSINAVNPGNCACGTDGGYVGTWR